MLCRTRLWTLSLLALLTLAAAGRVDAWGNPPAVQVDAAFDIRFDVRIGPDQMYEPQAPWFTYFPYDPHVHAPPAAGYPAWPQQWPPAAPALPPRTPMTPGSLPLPPTNVTYGSHATGWQPVSYFQAPSYWYGR